MDRSWSGLKKIYFAITWFSQLVSLGACSPALADTMTGFSSSVALT
jgi:hypothetical protein